MTWSKVSALGLGSSRGSSSFSPSSSPSPASSETSLGGGLGCFGSIGGSPTHTSVGTGTSGFSIGLPSASTSGSSSIGLPSASSSGGGGALAALNATTPAGSRQTTAQIPLPWIAFADLAPGYFSGTYGSVGGASASAACSSASACVSAASGSADSSFSGVSSVSSSFASPSPSGFGSSGFGSTDATSYISGYLAASVVASVCTPGPHSTSGAGIGTGGGGSGGATVSVNAKTVGSGESTWIIFAPGPKSNLSSRASRCVCANWSALGRNEFVKSSAVFAKSSMSTQTDGFRPSGLTSAGSLTSTQHLRRYTHASSTSYSSRGRSRASVMCLVSCSRSSRVTNSSTF